MTQSTWLRSLNSPLIDMRPDHLVMVLEVLEEYVPDYTVRAYGSRVNWSAKDASDLDLAVVGPEPLDPMILASLREAFEESDLPFSVDVMDWHSIPETFRQEIANQFVTIQDRHTDGPSSTLIQFAPLSYGKALKKSDRNSCGGVPVYGSNGIIGYHDKALTKGRTIVVGRKGSVGSISYSPVPCWPIDTTFFHEESDPEIARFKYFSLSKLGLDQMNSDRAVPGLNRNNAHSLQIRVPPIEEQRRISGTLGALDDKIELNRRMSKTLEDLAHALLKSWFIDFDPVRAKSEGRPTGLPPDQDALFRLVGNICI